MNYIKEINAFYDLMELEPLSASAVNLWHTLLHINNKARWALEFTVSSTVLKLKGGLSESSFQRARKELVTRGLVECRSRGQNLAPAYRMKRLYLEYEEVDRSKAGMWQTVQETRDGLNLQVEGETEEQLNQQVNGHVDHQVEGQVKCQTEALIKQKEIKQKETQLEVDAFIFYQENFGVVSPFVTEDILGWVEDVGEAFVVEAMKRGLERNKTSWGYVKSIMQSWVRKGIRTVEDARAEKVSVDKTSGLRRVSSGEVVPEWFFEQKRRGKTREREEYVASLEEVEVVEEMLERYLSGK